MALSYFFLNLEVWQGHILSPCLFSFYAENIMWNASALRNKIWREKIIIFDIDKVLIIYNVCAKHFICISSLN